MNTLIITEDKLIIKDDATVQLRILAVLLRKDGRWDVPYAARKNFLIEICGEFLFTENLLEDNVKLRSRIKKCMLFDCICDNTWLMNYTIGTP